MVDDRRHTEQGNERKQQLLQAAEQLFTEKGYGATRISDICAAAGVAKGRSEEHTSELQSPC